MKKLGFSKILLFTLVCIFQIYNVNNNLIGIDLGSESFKATMLRPQRPFTMVENIQSKTKTPTAIALKDDERVFGAEAMAKKPRIPKQVLVLFHEFLAEKYNSEEVTSFVEKFFVSYEMVEDESRGTIEIKIDFNKEEFRFSTEEIFGMLFRYIKFLADKFSNSDIKDCVVTVPSFFSYKQRQALVQAAEMSKLNLLGFVSENVAAAVHFSLNKHFNTTENFIFYNMGASYTQATLVSFLSNMQVKNNKTVEVSKTLTVLGETWDKNLGGNVFDYNLVRHLMNKFDEMPERKGKKSVQGDYRVAERILPSATKYKEILSANKETPVSILSVDSGMNLQTRLTREEFEAVNLKDLERSFMPIQKLLNITGVAIDKISQIELLGGSIRVPKVQEVLKSKLGENGNIVGTHMNGDDSMALGAAYVCANFSSLFKAGKIELYHGANYEVKLKLKHLENDLLPPCEETINANVTELADNCVRKLDKNTTLYKLRRGLDLARTVSLKHDGDIQVSLFEKFEENQNESLIMSFNITGMQKVLAAMKRENLKTAPKVSLRFKQDPRGLITLKADAIYELVLYLNLQTGPTGGSEILFSSNFTAPLSEEEVKAYEEELKQQNVTESERKTLLQMRKDVGRKKVREEKVELKVDVEFSSPRPLTKEEIKKSLEKLNRLDEIDLNRIKTMEKRNALESLIYDKKDWLQSQDAPLFSKEGEIDSATEKLNSIAEWYDDDGYSADFAALNTKFTELSEQFKNFEMRVSRHKERERALDNFYSEMKKVQDDALNLLKTKPWVESHYNNTFMKEVRVVEEWMAENKEKQSKLAHHEEPVLHSDNIEAKVRIIKREYYTLTRVPKPKPVLENVKIEDLMKNGTSIEDLIRKANFTIEDLEKIRASIRNKSGENNTAFESETASESESESESANQNETMTEHNEPSEIKSESESESESESNEEKKPDL